MEHQTDFGGMKKSQSIIKIGIGLTCLEKWVHFLGRWILGSEIEDVGL